MITKSRKTKETEISLQLNVDGAQKVEVQTGHGFFDHMLHQLAFHAGWDLTLKAVGDLHVDEHHLVEDTALLLGTAIQEVWRARTGMNRYGQRLLPMDDVLIMCALDLCGRPFCKTKFRFRRESVGGLSVEMVEHFFHSLAMAGAFNLHLRRVTGKNSHHQVEAAFKALAYAFREALTPRDAAASTKGVL